MFTMGLAQFHNSSTAQAESGMKVMEDIMAESKSVRAAPLMSEAPIKTAKTCMNSVPTKSMAVRWANRAREI